MYNYYNYLEPCALNAETQHFIPRFNQTSLYIFTAPTCTTTIITLEPCALNAEFQHFILRFNKTSLLADLTQRGG